MTRQLRAQGLAPATGTPDQFAAWIERERQKWARVAKDIKLKLD
jgi:tripartite-type tricarboxylate transporter receptor subunit TctC